MELKYLCVFLSLFCSASAAAIEPFSVIDLHHINFTAPDPAVGALLESLGENSTISPWSVGSCYRKPEVLGRNAILNSTYKWKNNILYYSFDYSFSTAEKNVMMTGMNRISANTCIKFVKRTTQKDYVSIRGDSSGCWSYVGRMGGKQLMNLQRRGCLYDYGTTIHEMSHALGIFHEHERNDRDTYLNVYLQNVDPDNRDQFDKTSTSEATTFNMTYDYSSVMHYDNYAFSINGKQTMSPKLAGAPSTLGNRDHQTALDIQKMKKLYGCP